MSTVLELGIKEGQRATWRSWGIAVVRDMGMVAVGAYLTLPLLIILKLRLGRPDPYPFLLGIPFTKWWWFEIDFRWYKFLHLEIGLPLWRSRTANKPYGNRCKER